MKTLAYFRSGILCLFIFLLQCGSFQAANRISQRDSVVCLEISGKVTLQNNPYDKKIKIELIYFNKVIDSMIVKPGKKFEFSLGRNAYYTLRISKPGYITRTVTIRTHLKKFRKDEDPYKFHFDTELLPQITEEILDPEVIEFPVAIIEFDEKLKAFFINEKYTSNIKKESLSK